MEQYKKILITLVTYISYATLGMSNVVVAPTLPNMAVLLDVNTAMLGLAVTGGAVGYFAGSVLCGLVFDRLDREVLLCLGYLYEGLTIGLAPHWGYSAYVALLSVRGASQGFLMPATYAYFLSLWKGHPKRGALLFSLQFFFFVLSALMPVIITPFLTEVQEGQGNTTQTLSSALGDTQTLPSVLEDTQALPSVLEDTQTLSSVLEDTQTQPTPLDVDSVRYAYVLAGALSIFSSLLFAVFKLLGIAQPEVTHDERNVSAGTEHFTVWSNVKFYVSIAVLFVVYTCSLSSISMYLATVVVQGFHWAVDTGALLTSLLWASFAIGQITSAVLSNIISNTTIVRVNLIVGTAAFVLMLFSERLGIVAMATAIVISGASYGPLLPGFFLWAAEHRVMTALIAATCSFGQSVGKIAAYTFTSYMIEHFSYLWMIYVVLGTSVLLNLWFLLSCCINREKVNYVVTMEVNDSGERRPLLE